MENDLLNSKFKTVLSTSFKIKALQTYRLKFNRYKKSVHSKLNFEYKVILKRQVLCHSQLANNESNQLLNKIFF